MKRYDIEYHPTGCGLTLEVDVKRLVGISAVCALAFATSPCLAMSNSYAPAVAGKAQFSDPDKVLDDTSSRLQDAYVAHFGASLATSGQYGDGGAAAQLFNTVDLPSGVASTEVRLNSAPPVAATSAAKPVAAPPR